MNKCLVTTLKAHTNNEALSKYNVLTIKTKVSDSPTKVTQWLSVATLGNGSVSINSSSVGVSNTGIGGQILPYPYTVNANAEVHLHFENKDGIIEITGKYNLLKLTVGDSGIVRIKEIYGLSIGTISSLNLYNIEEGEIDVTKLSKVLNLGKLTGITLPNFGNRLTVNIINRLSKNTIGEFKAIRTTSLSFCSLFDSLGLDDVANNVSIEILGFYKLKAGNLSSLAKLTRIKTIYFDDRVQNTGDIMDFINPWIQAGRTSGKIDVHQLLGQNNITLNGQPITYPSGVSNSIAYLNWTSNGTVTFTAS